MILNQDVRWLRPMDGGTHIGCVVKMEGEKMGKGETAMNI
jgi:hypothetical protein